MAKVTASTRSQVINKHLYSFSLSEIAKEVGISKTTCHNIVQDWNSRVSFLDLDDIRTFLSHLRKSGITIEQCVQGYRTKQLLERFGVYDDDELESIYQSESIEDEVGSAESNLDAFHKEDSTRHFRPHNSHQSFTNLQKDNKKSVEAAYQFSYFIEDIYKNCKKHDIKPSIIVRWIEDLFNLYSDSNKQLTNTNSVQFSNFIQKNADEEFQKSEMDDIYNTGIPLTSSVSTLIKENEKNIKYLERISNSIYNDITVLEKQRMDKTNALNKVIEKEKEGYAYLDWYNDLKGILFDRYGILIEQEIELFANALYDFKQYRYSATKILSEYKAVESLRNEKKQIQNDLEQNILKRNNLQIHITTLEEQSSYYKQTIQIYNELHKEGMGLKELKQLNYLIMESRLANGLEVKDSIKKFLRDTEDQYDSKLGFEKKINELKTEMEELKKQVPEYQTYLRLQGIVAPTLVHLSSSGVTNEDIIGMNHLVLEFKNIDFLSDPFQHDKDNNISGNSPAKTNNQHWILFVQKLKELRNINVEIQKQFANLNNLKRQISSINENRQKIDKAYLDAVSNLNNILTKIDQYTGLGRINEKTNNKNMIPIPVIFLVFVKYRSANKKIDNKKDNNGNDNHG
ncbi:MAG TPA: hypothetical protein VFV86_00650 [Nitrososphaeraceae archaeon]|nr:hypothetical protein [Nitrososphaeraceae archaeon]